MCSGHLPTHQAAAAHTEKPAAAPTGYATGSSMPTAIVRPNTTDHARMVTTCMRRGIARTGCRCSQTANSATNSAYHIPHHADDTQGETAQTASTEPDDTAPKPSR